MSTPANTSILAAAAAVLVSAVVACAPGAPDPEGGNLEGADETVASSEDGVSGAIPVGSTLVSTAGVNLRSGASTNRSVLHVVPDGGRVVVQQSQPVNGFYKVKHNGTVGWTYGAYYQIEEVAGDDGGDDGSDDGGSGGSVRDQAIARAKAAVGFSYWWGHGRFKADGATSSNKGSCSGSCPNCSHSGQYGGDCSGLAAKVWQVPSTNDVLSDDSHPYSTADFIGNTSQWSRIDRANVQKADALVYRSGGAGHIFVVGGGDGWGSMYAYECKGCSAGCIEGYRTASSAYRAIRRSGW
jgi:uncharacterized protein YraI